MKEEAKRENHVTPLLLSFFRKEARVILPRVSCSKEKKKIMKAVKGKNTRRERLVTAGCGRMLADERKKDKHIESIYIPAASQLRPAGESDPSIKKLFYIGGARAGGVFISTIKVLSRARCIKDDGNGAALFRAW